MYFTLQAFVPLVRNGRPVQVAHYDVFHIEIYYTIGHYLYCTTSVLVHI